MDAIAEQRGEVERVPGCCFRFHHRGQGSCLWSQLLLAPIPSPVRLALPLRADHHEIGGASQCIERTDQLKKRHIQVEQALVERIGVLGNQELLVKTIAGAKNSVDSNEHAHC